MHCCRNSTGDPGEIVTVNAVSGTLQTTPNTQATSLKSCKTSFQHSRVCAALHLLACAVFVSMHVPAEAQDMQVDAKVYLHGLNACCNSNFVVTISPFLGQGAALHRSFKVNH